MPVHARLHPAQDRPVLVPPSSTDACVMQRLILVTQTVLAFGEQALPIMMGIGRSTPNR